MMSFLITLLIACIGYIILLHLYISEKDDLINKLKKTSHKQSDMIVEYFREMKKLEIKQRDLEENYIFVERHKINKKGK